MKRDIGARKSSVFWIGVVLFLTLLLASCAPGSGVYEGPFKEKTSVALAEGTGYLVYFEVPMKGLGGGSSSSSARSYPILESIVTIYDDTGDTIPNIITSGKIKAYWSETRGGITVAQFRLEGNGSRSITLHVNMDAYREFATSYNKRRSPGGSGPGVSISSSAPSQPEKLVITEAGSFSFTASPIWLISTVIIVTIWLVVIFKSVREKNNGKKEPEQEIPERENMSSSL